MCWWMYSCCYYSSMKLQTGNTFSHVCLSVSHPVHREGVPMWSLPMIHWTSLCRTPCKHGTSLYKDPRCQNPSGHRITSMYRAPLLVTYDGHSLKPVQTCSFADTPNWYWHLVATETHTVGKQAVHILLECFLLRGCMRASGISKITQYENTPLYWSFLSSMLSP